jgi:hypothetical protein
MATLKWTIDNQRRWMATTPDGDVYATVTANHHPMARQVDAYRMEYADLSCGYARNAAEGRGYVNRCYEREQRRAAEAAERDRDAARKLIGQDDLDAALRDNGWFLIADEVARVFDALPDHR